MPDPARCPYCGEDVLVERDTRLGVYVCLVCARTWTEGEMNRRLQP
jgi:DNA-directed RNA polymerase subunit RPC12/RpoP